MSIRERIRAYSAQLSLDELRAKGALRVAQPSKVAAKIEHYTGVAVEVRQDGTIVLQEFNSTQLKLFEIKNNP